MQLVNRAATRLPIVPLTRPLPIGGIRIGSRAIATRYWENPGDAGKVQGESGGGDGNEGDGKGDDAEGDDGGDAGRVSFTDEQQAAINKIVAREARKAAAKAKTEAEQAATDAQAELDRKADQDAAAERGEFDTVRAALEGERDGFKASAEAALAILGPQVTTQWADLPDEVSAMYEGDEGDVLAQAAFLARTAKLVERITKADPAKGNEPNPDRKGGNGPEVKSLLNKRRAGFSN